MVSFCADEHVPSVLITTLRSNGYETVRDADVAAFVTLGEWLPEFEEFEDVERDELVARLRAFLEVCPTCDGELIVDSEVEAAVPAISCVECGAALF